MLRVCALFAGVALLLPGPARAANCANLPTQFLGGEFPSGDFFSNFNNACYTIPIPAGNGSNGKSGDLNAVYNQIYFKVNPQLQYILVGTFPNARYFSVTVYDEHAAISQTILDTNIVPLTSQYVNPFQPGAVFVPGQQYAVTINAGGTPGTQQTGCQTTGYNVDVNALDATVRHQGMDWNWDAALFQANPGFPLHVLDTPLHTNPNKAGVIEVRTYLDIDPAGSIPPPALIVRDVASGCAYPANYAEGTLQVLSLNPSGPGWLDSAQTQAHKTYEHGYVSKYCFQPDPGNLAWMRGSEYVPGDDPGSAYIKASVPANLPTNLAAAGEVIRIRGRVAVTPPTPCASGCSRTGAEQLRYASLSFQDFGGITLASLADNAFTKDPNGYVTLIVGTGAAIPSWITPANGYTFLDLTAIAGYQQLNTLEIRNILPSSAFNCSGQVVPFNTTEYTSAGGLMGEYLPEVDYPLASSLPSLAVPLIRPNSCGIFPDGQAQPPASCGVSPTPPEMIQTVTSQCAGPGCNQVTAQPAPPLTITGAGFGNFPDGLPFTGNSSYLEITDTTQSWDAGYGQDVCNFAISSWSYNLIQLVPNVGQSGICPLLPGDQLTVKVWNPQMPASPAAVAVTTVGNGITFSSSRLNFGNVTVGASVTLTETLTNQSSTPLQITGAGASGGFTEVSNCTGPVATGASCSITVTFSPAIVGVQTGYLSFGSNLGPPQSIDLSGTGVGVVLNLGKTTVAGGNPINANSVSQLDPAAPAGEAITLSSSNPAVAAVPASVSIAAGATSSPPFNINTTSVASTTPVVVTATYNGVATSAGFNVYAASLSTITLADSSVISGLTTHGNSVTLDGGAPPGGAVISLSSDNPAAASVPASLTITANTRHTGFAVTAGFVTTVTPVVITATYGGRTLTATITVNPLALTSLTILPASVIGGVTPGQSSNTVALNAPAPPGGTVVALSSSNPAVAMVAASVTVAAGKTKSPSFTITTTPVAKTAQLTISATYNGVTQSAAFNVVPPMVTAVLLSQSTVTGGNSVPSNQVQLQGAAPAGGLSISLSSSDPAAAAVPAAVTVPAGAQVSQSFTITTSKVTSATPVTITATYANSSQPAILTVEP